MQKFYLRNNLKHILFEDNLNVKPVKEIINIIQNKLIQEKLKLESKHVIEGDHGDFIIWNNKNIDLIGYCD